MAYFPLSNLRAESGEYSVTAILVQRSRRPLTGSRDVKLTDNLCQTTVRNCPPYREEDGRVTELTSIGKLSKITLQFEEEYQVMMLASSIYIDLIYFNRKVSKLTHHLKSYYITLEKVLATPYKQNLNSSNFIKVSIKAHSLMVFI